jgi:putative flavoprotein involved in K+ transport
VGTVLDVLVIGAGQAGLAAGYFLRNAGVHFELLDGAGRVGTSWRRRYDSLVLFSPRAFSALPGLAMDGDPEGYPTKDEVANYLERYARTWRMPVSTGEAVVCLEQNGRGFRALSSARRSITSRAVIVATGPFQCAILPAFAAQLCPAVHQLTAESYHRPADVPEGPVLVVGSGATGRQIALELAAVREVSLSMGRRLSVTPQRILGKDAMWWADRSGLLRAHRASLRGRLARRFDSFPGRHLRPAALQRCGVTLRARSCGAEDSRILFADGTSDAFRTVIWTVGYRDDISWLRVPGATSHGRPLETDGVSPVPGLFYVGRSWQTCRGSALLHGVGADAARIAAAAAALACPRERLPL